MAVLIILASFMSIALSKLKLPSLVGFLVAGILIHNYIDLPSEAEDVVSIFSNLGLIMLMFSIGMEIDIYKLKVQGRFAILIALIQIPVMIFTGIIAGSAMGYSSTQAITFGAILAGASTAVVLAVLNANKVLDQDKMDILVLIMIIEDITQVVLISVLTPMMKGESMSTDALVVLIIEIAVFMLASFVIGLKILPKIIDWFYKRSNDEMISLLCIGLAFVFALLANIIGLSIAIGAFIAGVMVGMSKPKHVVEHFIDPLKSLFMAMFFISVGMEVTVDSLFSNIPTVIIFYVIFALFMFTAVNIGYWVANGDSRNGWVSAMAMCTMGEFAFIISKLAKGYGVVDDSFYASIIGAAILSMLMLPLLVRSSEKSYNFLNAHCPGLIKKAGGHLTDNRNQLYHGLNVISRRTRDSFKKGLTNAGFIIVLITVIEVGFYYMYDPLSAWLADNFGLDEFSWRLIILVVNIFVLLEPCRRLAKFFRFVVYVTERGKQQINSRVPGDAAAPALYESISTLLIGSAIALLLVIVVPNGIDSVLHVLIMLGVLVFIAIVQLQKYKKALAAKNDQTASDEAGPEA